MIAAMIFPSDQISCNTGSLYFREYPHMENGNPLGKMGTPVWQTIFWKFRDPQCDAGLSASSAMLKQ